FYAKSRMLVLRRSRHQQAAVGPAGDAHQLKREFPAKPAPRGDIAALRILQRALHQVKEVRKFFFVELQNFCETRGIAQNIAAEMGRAKVHVENTYGERRHGAEERLDGGARNRAALRQRTEAYGVRGTRE